MTCIGCNIPKTVEWKKSVDRIMASQKTKKHGKETSLDL